MFTEENNVVQPGLVATTYSVNSVVSDPEFGFSSSDLLSDDAYLFNKVHGKVEIRMTRGESRYYRMQGLSLNISSNLVHSLSEVFLISAATIFVRSRTGFIVPVWNCLFSQTPTYHTGSVTLTIEGATRTIVNTVDELKRFAANSKNVLDLESDTFPNIASIVNRGTDALLPENAYQNLLQIFEEEALRISKKFANLEEVGQGSDSSPDTIAFLIGRKTPLEGSVINLHFAWYESKNQDKVREHIDRELRELDNQEAVERLNRELLQMPEIPTPNQEDAFDYMDFFDMGIEEDVNRQLRQSEDLFGCGEIPVHVRKLLEKTQKSDRASVYYNPEGMSGCFIKCLTKWMQTNYGVKPPSKMAKGYKQMAGSLKGQNVNRMTMEITAKALGITINLHEVATSVATSVGEEKRMYNTLDLSTCSHYIRTSSINPGTLYTMELLTFNFHVDVKHLVLIFKPSFVMNKASCKTCKNWLVYTTSHYDKHVESCVVCICGAAVVREGKHYMNCKGKQRETGETQLQFCEPLGSKKNVLENQYFADMECAPFGGKFHEPYCISVKDISKNIVTTWTGETCLQHFTNFLYNPKTTGYLWFHNGSGYDCNFLIRGIMARSAANGKAVNMTVINKGSRVLTFDLDKKSREKLAVRDMFLFLPLSLKKLCEDFRVSDDKSKKDFDHSKITKWEDVETHKKEIVEYCEADVRALEEIYKKFMSALYDIAPVIPSTRISLASHCFEMWKVMEGKDIVSQIHTPKNRQEYEIMRACYFGGRVALTRRGYESHLWKKFDVNSEEFALLPDDTLPLEFLTPDNTSDTLKIVDIVSLYPTMMKTKLFPVGKPVLTKITDRNYVEELRGDNGEDEEWWQRVMMLVDVSAPSDITVPYLMDRDENGKNIQFVGDHNGRWYTGVDLLEAIKIGYTINTCYAVLEWPALAYVFSKYITALFDLKQQNSGNKSSALYIAAKWGMNSVSGKLAQKTIEKVTRVVSNIDNLKGEVPLSVVEMDNGLLVELPNDKEEYKFPTHLSPFILSHARQHMSEILRSINGYKDPEMTYLYTDTDSLVLTKNAFSKIPERYIGKELGQLEDEYPNGHIVAARFVAPKTYCLAIVKEGKLFYKTRCKGVPHKGEIDPKDYSLSATLNPDSLRLFPDRFNVGEEDKLDDTFVDLGRKEYLLYKSRDSNVVTTPYIDVDVMDLVLSKSLSCDVIYGTLKRSPTVAGKGKQPFQIEPKWAIRGLSINSWWSSASCTRLLNPGLSTCDYVPPVLRRRIAYPPNFTIPSTPEEIPREEDEVEVEDVEVGDYGIIQEEFYLDY